MTTARGSAEATVEVSDAMLAGHASLPNGFGLDYTGEDGETVVARRRAQLAHLVGLARRVRRHALAQARAGADRAGGRMTTMRLERDGGLAVLTLDNPPLNQISEQVVDDLADVVTALEAADDVRALLVRGTGDVFSAGADVKLFAGRSAAEMRPLIERFLDFGRRVEALPFPTLAAVHGMCVAGGLELVLFLDLIWAAEGTNLGLLETRIGIVPLAGGIERVAARAGLGRARSIALSGNLFPAEQFEAWGIVDRVLPADELQPQAEKFAQRLAEGPARAFAAVKQFAAAYTEGGVAAADERLLEDAVGLFDTDDARNGIESFLVGRKATFAGR